MNVLVIHIGGTNVKILATGQQEQVKFRSGPAMTAKAMVAGVEKRTRDWKYDVISLGYPGPVLRGCSKAEPRNLAPRWVGFDFEAAFERPVKIINDAAMQALGGFRNFNLFEDLDFSRRMRCRGRIVTLRPPVISSARRFSLCRPWRTTWSDLSITRRYLRGVDPNRLAAKYYAGCQRAHRSAHLVTAASHNGSQ